MILKNHRSGTNTALHIRKLIDTYSFEKRHRSGKTKAGAAFVRKDFKRERLLLIGFGGTISSGYTPTEETIVPLFPSPAIKQIEYINLFGTSNLKKDSIDLLAKDSRKITDQDAQTLLDILHLVPHEKILITAGTYMLPVISLAILECCQDLHKAVALTGSILPAGFVASEADANIWSAISILNNHPLADVRQLAVMLVFHGRVFKTKEEFQKLNLHPPTLKHLVIQYPLTTVPTDNIL